MDIISFYENDRREDNSMMSMYDKKKLKLDLPGKVKKQDNSNAILTSPDLKLLKLDSPELERIILATAGSATPTPKQYRRGKGTTELSVKEQQEHYVRGFEDALNKMRQQAALTSANESINNNNTPPTFTNVISNNNNNNCTKPVQDSALNRGLCSLNTPQFPSTSPIANSYDTSVTTQDINFDVHRNDTNRTKHSEPQKPCSHVIRPIIPARQTDDITAGELLVEPVDASFNAINTRLNITEHDINSSLNETSTCELSTVPIDLHKQELVKTERKKHRNRVAASKCRKRKLERESNLQETLDQLKTRNSELNEIAAALKQQVCELKSQVIDHIKSGCKDLMPS